MNKYVGTINEDGFVTEYRIEPIRRFTKLQTICERKTGYCLVGKRISRPTGSNVLLGDYSYHWNTLKSKCLEIGNNIVKGKQ